MAKTAGIFDLTIALTINLFSSKLKTMKKPKIISNPKILGGKPIINGTRISVELILNLLKSGLETKEILQEYPQLKGKDIQAAIAFAVLRINREEIHPIVKMNGELLFPTL